MAKYQLSPEQISPGVYVKVGQSEHIDQGIVRVLGIKPIALNGTNEAENCLLDVYDPVSKKVGYGWQFSAIEPLPISGQLLLQLGFSPSIDSSPVDPHGEAYVLKTKNNTFFKVCSVNKERYVLYMTVGDHSPYILVTILFGCHQLQRIALDLDFTKLLLIGDNFKMVRANSSENRNGTSL